MDLNLRPFPHGKDLVVCVVTGEMHHGWTSKMSAHVVVRLERVHH